MNLIFTTALVLSVVSLSLQACPQGWRQSTIDPNKCYLVVTGKKIWFEANAYCQNAAPNSYLTSICSSFETYSLNALVTDTPSISSCDQLWIGANDFDVNGKFTFIDGNTCNYQNWGAGQPDLSNQCVSSQARTTGKWKTEPCGTENCFICEHLSSASGSTTTSSTTRSSTTTRTTRTTPTTTTTQGPISGSGLTDCYDWKNNAGASVSGIYRISPPGIAPFDVYCDMETEGGGWTVFHMRKNGNLVFWNRSWQEYKNGFNNGLDQNLWLGNDKIHVLSTKDSTVRLRADVWGDRIPGSPHKNESWFGEYTFSVGNEDSQYQLRVTRYAMGNEADAGLVYVDGSQFSTIDHDNTPTRACISTYQLGGGWLGQCSTYYALNGQYVPSQFNMGLGYFYSGGGFEVQPVGSRLMLRKAVQ